MNEVLLGKDLLDTLGFNFNKYIKNNFSSPTEFDMRDKPKAVKEAYNFGKYGVICG